MDDFEKEFDKAVSDKEEETELSEDYESQPDEEETFDEEGQEIVEKTKEAADLPPDDDWEHKYKSNVGRITAYQNQIEQLQSELNKVKQRQQEPKPTMPDSIQEWEELKETDPELVSAIERQIEAKTSGLKSELDYLKQNEQQRAMSDKQRYYEQQYAALDNAVEGWREIAASHEWKDWLDNSPRHIQQLSNTEDANELVWLFNQFRGQTAQTNNVSHIKEKRKRHMENSASQITSKGVTPAPGEPDDFESAFNYFVRKDKAG